MAQLTLRDVLAVPVVRAADPQVVAARSHLDRTVRWVHATELADPTLRSDDLMLTTGVGLPEHGEALAGYARSLAAVGAAGLMIELGRRWHDVLPGALVSACELYDLPLLVLRREASFAAITQAVGERIVDEQLAGLRSAERVHETFTELSLAEADARDVLAAVQRLSGTAVVLENEQHQVLDYMAGPESITDFLRDWSARSRPVRTSGRTYWDAANGWLITRLGARDRDWGRLIVHSPAPPTQTLVIIAERAAAALAMHRLHDRHRDNLVRRRHHELLTGLLADPTAPDLLRRCEPAGFPLTRRRFAGLVVRPLSSATRTDGARTDGGRTDGPRTDGARTDGARTGGARTGGARTGGARTGGAQRPTARSALDDVLAATVHALDDQDVAALVSEMGPDVLALVSVPVGAPLDAIVDRLAERIAARHRVVVGAGRAVDAAAQIDRTLREARQVVDAVRHEADGPVVHRLEDVHIRGLLTLLADDDRLRLFVSRELGALYAHDDENDGGLVPTLRALLEHPGSKSDAAASVHLSRPAFYARLAKIESLLGISLDDPDQRVSLHVALLADELQNRHHRSP